MSTLLLKCMLMAARLIPLCFSATETARLGALLLLLLSGLPAKAQGPSEAAEAAGAEVSTLPEEAGAASSTTSTDPPQAESSNPQIIVPTTDPQELRFNFSATPWEDVLLWLTEEAKLSLKAERFPEGTLSFVDPSRTYSVGEAMDLLNRQLLDRGFALVRRGRLLMLIDLESPLAGRYIENIAEVVPPDLLDQRAESDIVKTIFSLGAMSPEAADEELRQMLGPSMPMTILASARQVVVTDTVARLKAIRKVLEDATEAGVEVTEMTLEHRAADEILMLARPLLGLEEEESSNESIRIAIDPFGDRLYVAGEPSAVSLLQRIVQKADKPLATEGEGETEVQLPTLKTYTLATADPQTAFDVLSTLLAGLPDARLAIDPGTQSLIVRARPDTHKIVGETIAELEGQGSQVDTIQLRRLDPSAALLTLNKYFGISEESTQGPTIDGDPVTGRLWIRGSSDEIQQAKDLIDRLEGADAMGSLGDQVRVLPYTGQNASELLEQAKLLWESTGRKNQIRMLSPSGRDGEGFPERRINRDDPSKESKNKGDVDADAPAENPLEARAASSGAMRFVAQQQTGVNLATEAVDRTDANEDPATQKTTESGEAAEAVPAPKDAKPQGEIIITMSPQGLIVASDDPVALTDFEDLLRTLSEQNNFTDQAPTVFWLKFVKASVASSMVTTVLGGDSGSLGGSAGGGLMDELGGGLGMLGGLMGLGGGGGDMGGGGGGSILTATGSVSIVPDDRLNALIVQANAMDMKTIETILEVIDREESPEDVQTIARPRLIPVIYSDAKNVADIVKGVFADRMTREAGGGGGNRQPSPEDIIRALRGGRGGGGGGGEGEKSEPPKITIAVDERSNNLIVTATPQDFEDVRTLVEQIDLAGAESEETTSVLTLKGKVNPAVVQQALESVLGRPVASTSGSSSSSSGSASGNSSSRDNDNNNGPSAADIRRRIEMFRAMQNRGGGRPAGAGGVAGGGRPSPGGRGGGGRGGRGGRGG